MLGRCHKILPDCKSKSRHFVEEGGGVMTGEGRERKAGDFEGEGAGRD